MVGTTVINDSTFFRIEQNSKKLILGKRASLVLLIVLYLLIISYMKMNLKAGKRGTALQ